MQILKQQHAKLDGCIMWNAHNTVFGSKHALPYLCDCRTVA